MDKVFTMLPIGVKSYIATRLQRSDVIITVEEILKEFPGTDRTDLVGYLRLKVDTNSRLIFRYGRKGYCTRIIQGQVKFGVAKVNLIPDNLLDGPYILEGQIVSIIDTDHDLLLVQCGNITTWANKSEIAY